MHEINLFFLRFTIIKTFKIFKIKTNTFAFHRIDENGMQLNFQRTKKLLQLIYFFIILPLFVSALHIHMPTTNSTVDTCLKELSIHNDIHSGFKSVVPCLLQTVHDLGLIKLNWLLYI